MRRGKKIHFLMTLCLLEVFLFVFPVKAYSVETLDKSEDYSEIKEMEGELIGTARLIETDTDFPMTVEYEKAVKIYIDTNIFIESELSESNVHDILQNAHHIWIVPVRVSENEIVVCTVSRIPPVTEETKKELLKNGILTEAQINEREAEVGQWVIPTAYKKEGEMEYIENLNLILKREFNAEDGIEVILLGGTPGLRQPFGLCKEDRNYKILDWNNAISIESFVDTYIETAEKGIYSFEQVKEYMDNLPPIEVGKDGGFVGKEKETALTKSGIAAVVAVILAMSGGVCIYIKKVKNKNN